MAGRGGVAFGRGFLGGDFFGAVCLGAVCLGLAACAGVSSSDNQSSSSLFVATIPGARNVLLQCGQLTRLPAT